MLLLYLTDMTMDLIPMINPIKDKQKHLHQRHAFQAQKDLFLRKPENKKNFIKLLSDTQEVCNTTLADFTDFQTTTD